MIALVMAALSRVAEWIRSWSRDQVWIPTEAANAAAEATTEAANAAAHLELVRAEVDLARAKLGELYGREREWQRDRDQLTACREQIGELEQVVRSQVSELERLRGALDESRGDLAAQTVLMGELEESLAACSRANEDGTSELEQCRRDLAACREQLEELERGVDVEEAAMSLLSEDRILRIAELSRANEELSQELVRTRCALTDQAPYFQGLLGQETAKCANLAEELAERGEELERCLRALAEHQEMLRVEMAACAELAKRADETEDRLAESARDQQLLEGEARETRTALVNLCRGLGVGQLVGATESELAQAALGAASAQGERVGKLRDVAITTVRMLEDLVTDARRAGKGVRPRAVEERANLLMRALAADARDHRTRVGGTEPNEALAPPSPPPAEPKRTDPPQKARELLEQLAALTPPPMPTATVLPLPRVAVTEKVLRNAETTEKSASKETCDDCRHHHRGNVLEGDYCGRHALHRLRCELVATAGNANRDSCPDFERSLSAKAAALMNGVRNRREQLPSVVETQAGQTSSFPSIEKKASKLEVLEDVTSEHCSENGLKAVKVAKVGLEPSVQESAENRLECNRLQESLCGDCASTELGAPAGGSGKVDR